MRIALLLLCSALSSLHAAGPTQFLIKDHQIGSLRAGMTAADVAKQYPSDRVKVWEPYPRVQVIDVYATTDKTKEPAFRLNLDRSGKAYSIEVKSTICQTPSGISLGSTFGSLKKAYPKLRVGSQEGEMDQFIQAEAVEEGIHFYLKFDQDLWKRIKRQPNSLDVDPSLIPNDAVINGIMVT